MNLKKIFMNFRKPLHFVFAPINFINSIRFTALCTHIRFILSFVMQQKYFQSWSLYTTLLHIRCIRMNTMLKNLNFFFTTYMFMGF